jgi:primosomal protein N' (replication factor Y) (superfamily II helicase)
MESLLSLLEDSEDAPGRKRTYVDVILPLPLEKLYTYSVPLHLIPLVKPGVRVEVHLASQGLYSGIIKRVHQDEKEIKTKPILSVLDESAIISEKQFRLWDWIAEYYCCYLGEVMQAALPAGLKLSGESKLKINENFPEEHLELEAANLNQKEIRILELMFKYRELSLEDLQKLLNQKSVQQLLKPLIERGILLLSEELEERYKPKKIAMLRFTEPFNPADSDSMKKAFELAGRSNRQMEVLLASIQILREKSEISRKELSEKASADSTVLKKLQEKGIFEFYEKEISRIDNNKSISSGNFQLSKEQQETFEAINKSFETKNTVLLHGVTGSGKTQVFVELMEQCIREGKQVLYLLPEIALTAQIVGRLQKHFSDRIQVYHSKFNRNERVEIWKSVQNSANVVLGARSALFLPFKNLGLIIVDEEHDSSYKQQDPSPRYHARDSAIFLASLFNAKTLLGTATPSLESMRNVQEGKYGFASMTKRYGEIALPQILIVDAAEEHRQKRMKSHFTQQLLDSISETIAAGEQVILFQNRRGYAPIYQCSDCGWTAECTDCDVSMTYHKLSNSLHCHYCANRQVVPKKCPTCNSVDIKIKGFGTEKIEDDLKIYFPEMNVMRMDWDSVKGRDGVDRIIHSFETGETELLVGTQMISKGLDFDNVGLVGVLSADQLLHFPDFRASERTYQLITQVAGRAGRKKKQGKVIVQAHNLKHPVLMEILEQNFENYLSRELKERKDFQYPPFIRLIHIQLRHKKINILEDAAIFVANRLKASLGDRVLGPAVPGISRIRSYYLMDFLIKMGLHSVGLNEAKKLIRNIQQELKSVKNLSGTRMVINVDPY